MLARVEESKVTRIRRSDAERIVQHQSAGDAAVFTFDTQGVADRDGFFDAARLALPLDPPLGTFRNVWDALADSLFGGLAAMNSSRIAIIWIDSSEFESTSPEEFEIALDVFRQVAVTIAEKKFTDRAPKDLRVFVA